METLKKKPQEPDILYQKDIKKLTIFDKIINLIKKLFKK